VIAACTCTCAVCLSLKYTPRLGRGVTCLPPAVSLQGETLQGRFPCGCSVFAEQVSHHPPVSCWQLLDHNGQVGGHAAGRQAAG
jgi:hypothetical protein